MTIQITSLKGLDQISTEDLLRPFDKIEYSTFERSLIEEKAQMRDQIEMLEREVDRQETIIDALVKAIKVIERG